MQDMTTAGTWRAYDIAVLCYRGDSDRRTTYVKFHHCGVVLHLLCICCHTKQLPLPQWLKAMARNIKLEWKGNMSYTDIVAEGLAATGSMQLGNIKVNWQDLVMNVLRHGEAFGTGLQERVFKLCPEHARQIHDWTHLRALVTRITMPVWIEIENFMNGHGVTSPRCRNRGCVRAGCC